MTDNTQTHLTRTKAGANLLGTLVEEFDNGFIMRHQPQPNPKATRPMPLPPLQFFVWRDGAGAGLPFASLEAALGELDQLPPVGYALDGSTLGRCIERHEAGTIHKHLDNKAGLIYYAWRNDAVPVAAVACATLAAARTALGVANYAPPQPGVAGTAKAARQAADRARLKK